jgi:hypothetical protein
VLEFVWDLVLEYWCLFVIWCLGFGAYLLLGGSLFCGKKEE